MRLAIDIDSTLHHYWDVLSAAARRRFGIDLPYEIQATWDITGLHEDQVKLCVAETHSEDVILAGKPYPHAVETVNRWYDEGHFIHITSHRDPSAHDATARWLERIGLRHHELYCSFDKVSRCRDIAIDVLIDDSPQTIAAALQHGILPATLCHPWNGDVCKDEHVLCAHDWPGLAALLDPILAARRATPAA